MRMLSIGCLVWFLVGGSWPWIVGAFLLWEFGGNASIIGSVWLSGKAKDRDHEP